MILVGTMAAVMWGIGAATGAPKAARWNMIGLLIVAVLAIQIALPDGHPLRENTGGSPAFWLMLLAFAGVALGYRALLRRVRARAHRDAARPDPSVPVDDDHTMRHARHLVLREIGGPGQARLRAARVLIVGAGGLGNPAALYLAGAGVGTIGIVDDDTVEASNLQRQVAFRDADTGRPKAQALADRLVALDPRATVRAYSRHLDRQVAEGLVGDYDLVLDGTDDFATRQVVNAACVAAGVPLISGAIAQWDGQVTAIDPARGTPCLRCLFPAEPAPGLAPDCATGGVAGPLPGIIGTIMALEAVKILTGAGQPLWGRLLLWDGLGADARTVEAAPDPDCPVCLAHRPEGVRSRA
ncbi:MAG: HesA/MoeB/ThiF family protein [Paracoccaceae bacterium]